MSLLGLDVTYSKKDKKRVKYGLFSGGLVVILVMAALLSRPPVLDPLPGKITVTMTAQVFRGGVLIGEAVNEDDLLLYNFLNICQALLHYPNNNDYTVQLRIDEGADNDFLFWNDTIYQTIGWTDASGFDNTVQGWIGSGNTAPTRMDNILDSGEISNIDLDSFAQEDDSFTLTFVYTNDQGSFTWCESAISPYWFNPDAGEPSEIFICRDVFSGISVVNDDVLVLNYQFNFATGYTENFITLLLYLIMGAAYQETQTITLTDISGTSRTVTLYDDDRSNDDWLGHYDGTNHGGWIRISDNAYGIPSRSAYMLYGSSISTYATVAVDGNPNYDVTASAVMIPGSAISVVASSYERYTSHSGGDAWFMFFALSHGSVYVASGTPVRAEFTLEM